MTTIIPLPYYVPVFYNIILFLILNRVVNLSKKRYVIDITNKKEYLSLIVFLFVVLFMGLRPISGRYFGDMRTYYNYFIEYANGAELIISKDILWNIFMKYCSTLMSAKSFFLLCAFIYVYPLYLASKRLLGGNRYLLFLMFVSSFSFWSYGTNGIRNGIATSLFVYAITFYDKKLVKYSLFTIASLIHASLIIPITAFLLTLLYKNTKHYFIFWLLCIPLSILFGGVFQTFILELDFLDSRVIYLTNSDVFNQNNLNTGFRWDFLLYSVAAVWFGYYFILKHKFKDKLYTQLFNIFLITNGFWILVIRANFSNRFAYLSWFLMSLIIFYPFFKKRFFKNQQSVLILCILSYFGFTYLMFLIS